MDRLTEFYFWLASGGVLGGAFNVLAAPLVFRHAGLVEYPLMLLLACGCRAWVEAKRPSRADLLWPAVLGAAVAAAIRTSDLPAGTDGLVRRGLLFGVPLVVAFTFVDRPLRFAAALAALLLAGALLPGAAGRTVFLERNVLGVVRVTASPDGRFLRMVHGNTIHGQQRRGASEPLTYYARRGPAGRFFGTLVAGRDDALAVGAVGLGTGSLAWYARPGDDWTFFELDPTVVRLARDDRFFTYLADSHAASLRILGGDARARLRQLPDGRFDVLVLDAFSSDAIPMHLLTAEALALYRRKLRPGGALLFHVSNRYVDLAPILGRLAATARPPLAAKVMADESVSQARRRRGVFPSTWVAMADRPETLAPLRQPPWFPIEVPPGTPRWTDDFADLFGALKVAE